MNSDGLVNDFLADYDHTPEGRRSGGHDLALVCHCTASFPQYDPEGKVLRGGFREASGDVRQIQTERGLQPMAASLSKDVTRELHKRRRQLWQQAEDQMTEARTSGVSPWFITETKAMLQTLDQGSGTRGEGLQSLGSILGTAPIPL